MLSLAEKFVELEELLLKHRHTLALHAGVPFVLLVYDPAEERRCREEQAHLVDKLRDGNLVVHEIPVETFVFDRYAEARLLDRMFEMEATRPQDVYRDLSKNYRPALAQFIRDGRLK
jgi:hypothetical protein